MNRLAISALFAAILSPVSGCGPADTAPPYQAPSYSTESCGDLTSCAACTPALGCGWCSNPDGTGWCGSSPRDCTTQWTWELDFCSATPEAGTSASADAGASSPDGSAAVSVGTEAGSDSGTSAGRSADAASDSAPQQADAASDSAPQQDVGPSDADSVDASVDQLAAPPPILADGGGCVANDGSSCSASEPYGFTCTRTGDDSAVGEPPASLQCGVAATSAPVGTIYYCCLYGSTQQVSIPR